MGQQASFHAILEQLLSAEHPNSQGQPPEDVDNFDHGTPKTHASPTRSTLEDNTLSGLANLRTTLGKAQFAKAHRASKTTAKRPATLIANSRPEPPPRALPVDKLSTTAIGQLYLLGWTTGPVTEKTLKRLYRAKVRACHPDLAGKPTDDLDAIYRAHEALRLLLV